MAISMKGDFDDIFGSLVDIPGSPSSAFDLPFRVEDYDLFHANASAQEMSIISPEALELVAGLDSRPYDLGWELTATGSEAVMGGNDQVELDWAGCIPGLSDGKPSTPDNRGSVMEEQPITPSSKGKSQSDNSNFSQHTLKMHGRTVFGDAERAAKSESIPVSGAKQVGVTTKVKVTKQQQKPSQPTSAAEKKHKAIKSGKSKEPTTACTTLEKRDSRVTDVGDSEAAEACAKASERKIGAYTLTQRKDRIRRFLEKRKRRVWKKRIKYDCRKTLASARPRIKGRFAKTDLQMTLQTVLTGQKKAAGQSKGKPTKANAKSSIKASAGTRAPSKVAAPITANTPSKRKAAALSSSTPKIKRVQAPAPAAGCMLKKVKSPWTKPEKHSKVDSKGLLGSIEIL